MARNLKSTVKAERADHRKPRDERLDRDAVAGLLPPEELDRPPDSRLTAGDLKRAAARAKGVMGSSKKLDPSLKIAPTRESKASSSAPADGMKKSRGAPAAEKGLDKGSAKKDGAAVESGRIRRTKSNAEIAESDTSTARKSPAPRAARADLVGAAGEPSTRNKRTGGARQRAPAPGNVTTITKREAVTGQKQSKVTGVRSTSSTGGSKPPKQSGRAGQSRGGSRARGAHGTTIE